MSICICSYRPLQSIANYINWNMSTVKTNEYIENIINKDIGDQLVHFGSSLNLKLNLGEI